MTESWWRSAADGSVIIAVHVQPNAARSEFAGLHGAALKIRLAAPAVDGKANRALIEFLAETLDVAKSGIAIVSGETARQKRVRVSASVHGEPLATRLQTMVAARR